MDVRGLADSCISVIQECSFITIRLEQINRNFKGVPLCVVALAEDLDKWMELFLEVLQIVKKGDELLDMSLRSQLSGHWDDIKALIDDGMRLIDEFDRKKHVREKAFIDLAKSFKEERARLHTWVDLTQLKVGEIDTSTNNTAELKEMVKKLLEEVRRLQNNSVQRPDSIQSPTDLGQPTDDELQTAPIHETGESSKRKGKAVHIREKAEGSKKKKGKAVDKPAAQAGSLPSRPLRPVYVDMGTQTESFASSGVGHTLPLLSHFPPELDLTEPTGFPVCLNGRWRMTGSRAT